MKKKTSAGAGKQWKRFACLVMLCCVMALVSGEPPAAAAPLVVAKTPVDARAGAGDGGTHRAAGRGAGDHAGAGE